MKSDITLTGAFRPLSVRIRIFRRQTTVSETAGPPIRPMSACAATITLSSALTRPSRSTGLLRKYTGGRLTPAKGPGTLFGVLIDIDDKSGKATHIEQIKMSEKEA